MINTKTLADGTELLNTVKKFLDDALITKDEFDDIKNALSEYLFDLNRVHHKTPKVTCAGIYNSGKSSVLNALTGGDNFKVGDVPTTATIDEFEQNGFIYVDTPGLNANNFDNETAQKAFKEADVILFVTNMLSGGLSAAEADYLKQLAEILGGTENLKAQTIFAMSNLHQTDDDSVKLIIDEHSKNIETTLGFKPDKIIAYDAVTYETGVREKKRILVKSSGIHELQKEIAATAKKVLKISKRICITRLSSKESVLESTISKVILSLEDKISKLYELSKAREVNVEKVKAAIEKSRKIIDETKETINPPSTESIPEIWFRFPSVSSDIIEEKTKLKVEQKIKERLRKVYDSRERVVREAANEALDKIRAITTLDNTESNFFFCNGNKAMNALLSCNEEFKKANVVLPVELLKPIEYGHNPFSINESSVIEDLTYGTVNYDYPYSLDSYSSSCEIFKVDYNGIFNIKYKCFSAREDKIISDVKLQFNSNFRLIWNKYASKLGDFCENIKKQLDLRLESMIQEAESIAGSSGSDIKSEIDSLKAYLESIKKYIE